MEEYNNNSQSKRKIDESSSEEVIEKRVRADSSLPQAFLSNLPNGIIFFSLMNAKKTFLFLVSKTISAE